METPEPTGADLDILLRSKHPFRQSCKGCGSDDVMRTGITDLAYVFDVCNCDAADYEHLVESIWHRECLVGAEPMRGSTALDELLAYIDDSLAVGYLRKSTRARIEHRVAMVRRALSEPESTVTP